MRRIIIKIDGAKCTGCGLCVPNCAEGALQIIDGKARLTDDVFCDGLGACLKECPEGALTLEEREAPPFDEEAVAKRLAVRGSRHEGSIHQAGNPAVLACGCPASSERVLARPACSGADNVQSVPSQLGHWPIQMHLISPRASFLQGSDLLVAADCVPFACANFHQSILKGHALLIGCPKLDDAGAYVEKLATIIAMNHLHSITVVHMEVGCCYSLEKIVRAAIKEAGMNISFQKIVISTEGEIIDG